MFSADVLLNVLMYKVTVVNICVHYSSFNSPPDTCWNNPPISRLKPHNQFHILNPTRSTSQFPISPDTRYRLLHYMLDIASCAFYFEPSNRLWTNGFSYYWSTIRSQHIQNSSLLYAINKYSIILPSQEMNTISIISLKTRQKHSYAHSVKYKIHSF